MNEITKFIIEFNELIGESNNINDLIDIWAENQRFIKELNKSEEMLKTKIKTYLKKRRWDTYLNKRTNVSIKLEMIKQQTIDKQQLKILLTDSQYSMIQKISTHERLTMVTPSTRKALKDLIK